MYPNPQTIVQKQAVIQVLHIYTVKHIKTEDHTLLGCDAMEVSKWVPTLQRTEQVIS
jgi:hypothetical protein